MSEQTASEPASFQALLDDMTKTRAVSESTARQGFDAIFAGAWNPEQVAAFIVALRVLGESAQVIASAARSMRAQMVSVEHSFERVLDTCGTGGDGQGTVNLSTGAAIIAAAAGVPVAKHGNRAISSKAGSADVLGALGIATDTPAAAAPSILKDAGIAFLMAPLHHPAMRHAMPARKQLGARTIFNCLGPLTNPAGATHQLIGAYADPLRRVMAETLKELGSKRAWVVRGADGLDEISPYGATLVTELSGGKVRDFEITPADFGLKDSPAGATQGGDAEFNAQVIETVLADQDHPSRDAFILNAAAALVVAEDIEPKAATERVRELLKSGAAKEKLDQWRRAVAAAKS